MGTLMAQMTRQWVDKVVKVIRSEREKGVPFAALNRSLKQGLPNFDAHTRQRLLDLASDLELADDFAQESIAKSEQLKPNTIRITLAAPPEADLGIYSLIRFHGAEWLVTEQQGDVWTLKLLE
ncbi:MAG: hypothetical protein M5U26_21465 [Planctomycetota bacterium]|nr:hypothetical protein [Planctomycetota bacterium]